VLNAAIAAAGTLQGASLIQLAPVAIAANAALTALAGNIATVEADIDPTTVGGVGTGTPAPVLATALLRQASDVLALTALETAKGYVGRVAANLSNAPG
jgi:hypothetical protein